MRVSVRELDRAKVCERVSAGDWSVREAAGLLGLSYRQARRVVSRYRVAGAAGLVHGSVGRRSNRALPLRHRVLALVEEHYSGSVEERLGPTLAAEHLGSDHGIQVDAETLRRWMLSAGLWSRRRKRRPYRQRRERRAHFGELVQLDGSFHHWLGSRAPKGCLVVMIDDATNITLARFAEGETTWAAASLLESWVEKYGVPRALYTDGGSVYYHRTKALQALPLTQFAGMCARIGSKMIRARSPQAKGRVERANGTHQDRLIKKLRLKGISSYDEANEYLAAYLSEHNRRFAKPASDPVDWHLQLDAGCDRSRIFCQTAMRVVSQDWVVRYKGRWLQLSRRTAELAHPGSRVRVEETAQGVIRLWTRADTALGFKRITPVRGVHHTTRPSDDHPWKRQAIVAWRANARSPNPNVMMRDLLQTSRADPKSM